MTALFAVLAFQLVFVVNQIHFPWETGIPALAPANFLLVLILLLMRGKTDSLHPSGMLRRSLLLFFGAMVIAFFIGELRDASTIVADVTYLKNSIAFPAFYFVYLHSRQDEKRTRQLMIVIMVVAAVAGLEAIREGIDYGIGTYNQFHRASGPFGVDWHDANRAGVYYGMFAPMFIAIALFAKGHKLWRLAAIGGFLLVSGGALFTYSRQAYLLVVVALALLLLRKSLIVAVLAGVILVSGASLLPESVFQRVEETQQKSSKGQEEVDVSTASRWEIWAGAMGAWSDSPMGIGLNHFKRTIGGYCKYKGMDAHNFYVLTLTEMGPLGLAAFLNVIWNLFRLAAFLRKNAPRGDPEAVALATGFTVATVCMCLGGMYGSPTLEPAVMGTYWALAGLMERYMLLKAQGVSVPEVAETPLHARFPLARYLYPGARV